jgi:hypothetical protein
LTANIECEYELTKQLKRRDILTKEQFNTIEGIKSNRYSQNAALLEMLSEHTDVQRYEKFLDALRDMHQSHLANYITAGGDIDEGDDDRPLHMFEVHKLRVLRAFLVKNIHWKELVKEMQHKKCMSYDHWQGIEEAGVNDDERVNAMLDIVERRSYKHFKLFLECLRFTGQARIAREIEHPTGIIHANI